MASQAFAALKFSRSRLGGKGNNVHGVMTKDGTPKTFYKPSPKAGGNTNGHKFATNDDWWNAKPSVYNGSIQ